MFNDMDNLICDRCDGCNTYIDDKYYFIDDEKICETCLIERIIEELFTDDNFYNYIIKIATKEIESDYLAQTLLEDIFAAGIIDMDWKKILIAVCNIDDIKYYIKQDIAYKDQYWLVETYLEFNTDCKEHYIN